jgi:hypothetical protein
MACYNGSMTSVKPLWITLLVILSPLLTPSFAFAGDSNVTVTNNSQGSSNNVSVNSTNNGTSTTCINGKCTTTGGGSHSTVCVNGKCTESTDGNVDMQSDDGKTQVHINNSTGGNEITTSTPTPSSSQNDSDADHDTDKAEAGSTTPTPTKVVIKKPITATKFSLFTFFKQEFSSLKRFFSFGLLK